MWMVLVRLILLVALLPIVVAGIGGAGTAMRRFIAQADGRLTASATASTTPVLVEAIACQLRVSCSK
jgi:hypothetical protein